jgi:hypothetical protein
MRRGDTTADEGPALFIAVGIVVQVFLAAHGDAADQPTTGSVRSSPSAVSASCISAVTAS